MHFFRTKGAYQNIPGCKYQVLVRHPCEDKFSAHLDTVTLVQEPHVVCFAKSMMDFMYDLNNKCIINLVDADSDPRRAKLVNKTVFVYGNAASVDEIAAFFKLHKLHKLA